MEEMAVLALLESRRRVAWVLAGLLNFLRRIARITLVTNRKYQDRIIHALDSVKSDITSMSARDDKLMKALADGTTNIRMVA